MIDICGVSKYYDKRTVVDNVKLEVKEGEFFVIVGPSGSGKTTILKMINRLIEQDEGDIIIDGNKKLKDYDLRELRLEIGYVLQQIALFPNMTVLENVSIVPDMKKWPMEKTLEAAKKLLRRVGLDPEIYLKAYPSDLSGGEQQKVGIIRALITNPKILLMDEPFSALDPISKNQLQELVLEIHKEMPVTLVFVTHDMNEAMRLGDRICVMYQGKALQVDTPENIRNHPANEFVESFFKLGGVVYE